MATTKEIGIVIKSLDYDDHDQIITILTNDELITFIALGVRKLKSKNRVALQLGNAIEVELFRARLSNKISKLKKAVLLKQIPIKEGDTALILFEILKVLKFIKTPSTKLFKSFIEVFKDWGYQYNQNIKTYILTRVLDVYGKYPIMNKCVECGRNDNIIGFEFYKGGFTCNLHTSKKLSLDILMGYKDLGLSWENYKNTSNAVNDLIFENLKKELNIK